MSVNKVNSDGSTTLLAGATLWADSPIGTILAYGGATAPAGWFICQGQELTKTDYAELYAVIGDSFGTASVNTKFVLPDLRESSLKGVGLTSKSNNHYDSDGVALGEFVEDRVQQHTHYVYGKFSNKAGTSSQILELGSSSETAGYTSGTNSGRSGATTEVKAVGVNYIIKAKQVALPADLESAVEDAVEEAETKYYVTPSNTSLTASTFKTLASITIEKAGVYLVNMHACVTKVLTNIEYGVTTSASAEVYDDQKYSSSFFNYADCSKVMTISAGQTIYFRLKASNDVETVSNICLSAIKLD